MNKILFILCLTSASLWMLSCTDYEVASYPEENETEVFNGTTLFPTRRSSDLTLFS